MTKMKDDQTGRRPKWNTNKLEDDQKGRQPKSMPDLSPMLNLNTLAFHMVQNGRSVCIGHLI